MFTWIILARALALELDGAILIEILELDVGKMEELAKAGSLKMKGHSDKYLQLECYQPQQKHTLTVSVAVDAGYYAKFGSETAVREHVESMLEIVSRPYEKQLNVYLKLGQLVVPPAGTRPLNEVDADGNYTITSAPVDDDGDCENPPLSMHERAAAFNTWRKLNHPQQDGVWHLLTTCNDEKGNPIKGTFGTAGHKGICSVNYAYSVIRHLSLKEYDMTPYIWAHELGHNFGGKHPWETDGCMVDGQECTGNMQSGVMDRSGGQWNGVMQFHPSNGKDMCATIKASLANSGSKTIEVSTETNEADDNDIRLLMSSDRCWYTENISTTTTTTGNTTATTTTSSPSSSLLLPIIVGSGVGMVFILGVCCGCYWRKRGKTDSNSNDYSRPLGRSRGRLRRARNAPQATE